MTFRKKLTAFTALLLLLALLCGCGAEVTENRCLVFIEESDAYTVQKNGLSVSPGGNASFYIIPSGDAVVTGAEYSGEYSLKAEGDGWLLQLTDIRFPQRIRLCLSYLSKSIRYEPNGGSGEAVEISYDTSLHRRVNTAASGQLFTREGFTHTGWNSSPDGTGTQTGLGSRVTVEGQSLTLYAQWAQWSAEGDFVYELRDEGAVITGYIGSSDRVVIPSVLGGQSVTCIASDAFRGCSCRSVVLSPSLFSLEENAFRGCALEELLLFDNIESISDAVFTDCASLKTLRIAAAEAPYGYKYRRESVYADKLDLLIESSGQPRIIFYGGCAMWYNLDPQTVKKAFGDQYTLVNLAINGVVSSNIQMMIMERYLTQGDILLHTPELSSTQQLLLNTEMSDSDVKLWCGIENNYDLFANVDMTRTAGVFDSLNTWLSRKRGEADYSMTYLDSEGHSYCDEIGCIPFTRDTQAEKLADTDRVFLNTDQFLYSDFSALEEFYRSYAELGVRVYVSYSCLDMDELPITQRGHIDEVDEIFRALVSEMGATPVSHLAQYVFPGDDFYDTAFHLLTPAAVRCTNAWIRDLQAQLRSEG